MIGCCGLSSSFLTNYCCDSALPLSVRNAAARSLNSSHFSQSLGDEESPLLSAPDSFIYDKVFQSNTQSLGWVPLSLSFPDRAADRIRCSQLNHSCCTQIHLMPFYGIERLLKTGNDTTTSEWDLTRTQQNSVSPQRNVQVLWSWGHWQWPPHSPEGRYLFCD